MEKEEGTDMFLDNDAMMYDDVPFVVLLTKNPKNSQETFHDTEETLRPVIIKKVSRGTIQLQF